jgi:hypothetical protein
VCTSSYYGYTPVVPGNLSVTDPSLVGGGTLPPVSLVGVGPTGMLVQSNAADGENLSSTAVPPYYQNLLGAGTGAIGLPQPSSALSTSTLVGTQYLGFIYGSGIFEGTGSNGPSTYVASFGFATPPSGANACSNVAAQTPTMIYGSDFGQLNNPGAASVQSNGGFPLTCNIAIDLGTTQSPNGFYPSATVWLGAGSTENGSIAGGVCVTFSACAYPVPAVAIAGQLAGKSVIFVTALDDLGVPNQVLGIYLLQSN